MIDALRVRCAEGVQEETKGGAPPEKKSRVADSSASVAAAGNQASQCNWRDVHKKECPYVVVRCPDKCGKQMRRMDVDEHKKECRLRKVECDLCHEFVHYSDLEYHMKNACAQRKVKCKYCGEEMTSELLGEKDSLRPQETFEGVKNTAYRYCKKSTGHYTQCPKMELYCEFYQQGCRAKFKRGDAAAHHAEAAQYHAALVSQQASRLYDWFDWDYVQMRWCIARRNLNGRQRKVFQSETLTGVSQYELYLKLYLRGPGDPIKVAICSDSMNCCPFNNYVELKKIEISITESSCNMDFANVDYGEEKEVKFRSSDLGDRGVFEFSSTLRSEKNKRDLTRADLIDCLDHYQEESFVIRAAFCIKKTNNVILRTIATT